MPVAEVVGGCSATITAGFEGTIWAQAGPELGLESARKNRCPVRTWITEGQSCSDTVTPCSISLLATTTTVISIGCSALHSTPQLVDGVAITVVRPVATAFSSVALE